MSARRPSSLPSPLAWFRSGVAALSLTLLTPLADSAHAGMIGTGTQGELTAEATEIIMRG